MNIRTLVLAFALGVAPAMAQAFCQPTDKIVAELRDKFGGHPKLTGIVRSGTVSYPFEVWVNGEKFKVMIRRNEELACILGEGTDLKVLP